MSLEAPLNKLTFDLWTVCKLDLIPAPSPRARINTVLSHEIQKTTNRKVTTHETQDYKDTSMAQIGQFEISVRDRK